ncbi:MAG: energy-coupling factor transporter transmembrane component T [bacterium]
MPSGTAQYREVGELDELARLDSPVHRLDARAQAVTTMVFIIVVMSYSRYEVSGLMPLFLYPVALIAAGRLPVGILFRKVAVAAPFALFVGIFNPLLDRHVVATFGSFPVSGGWLSFASIMIRFFLTVSTALILVSCTGIHRLCAGLERLGMPRVFAVQLLFLYRFFFVIGDEGLRMRRSVEIRSAGSTLGFTVYGHLIGHLLLRAMDRAQRIYRAMVARGFDGEIRMIQPATPGWREAAFVAGWTVFFLAARVWNGAEWLGTILTRM